MEAAPEGQDFQQDLHQFDNEQEQDNFDQQMPDPREQPTGHEDNMDPEGDTFGQDNAQPDN